jgi:hypothetical protein
MLKINLLINWFNEAKKERVAEYVKCLSHAVTNPDIDRIIILADQLCRINFPPNPKIVVLKFRGRFERVETNAIKLSRPSEFRPTYNDFIHAANAYADSETISIIANTDLVYSGLSKLKSYQFKTFECLELSRFETNGAIVNTGEDAWIFKGKIKPNMDADFYLGQLGCDWLFTKRLREAGYQVRNVSLDITALHLHDSKVRNYKPHNTLCNVDYHTKPGKL